MYMHKDISYAFIQGGEGDVPLEQISKNEGCNPGPS